MKMSISLLHFISLYCPMLVLAEEKKPAGYTLKSTVKIWDKAEHNAFTDLIFFKENWLCVFREGTGHVSPDGAIRILKSPDGEKWESAGVLTATDADLRDPKISLTPRGELMIVGVAAMHDKTAKSHQTRTWFSSDAKTWTASTDVGDSNVWIWRVDWQKETGYGVGYSTSDNKQERFARLYSTRDGKSFDRVVDKLQTDDFPNEARLLFEGDQALCLLRRDGGKGTGLLGVSKSPYKEWQWKDLGVRIGGPNFIRTSDGRLLAVVRLYDKKVRTSICEIDEVKGTITEKLALPSGGDTSYAGLALNKEASSKQETLWISYYSSHEKKTCIYLSKVGLD